MKALIPIFCLLLLASTALAEGAKDKAGRYIVTPSQDRRLVVSGSATVTTTTETTLIPASTAGIYNDLSLAFCNNTSATGVRVDFRDTTGGAVIFAIDVPAGDIRGIAPPTPIPQTAAAKNWTIKLAAGVTDIRCYGQAIENQ